MDTLRTIGQYAWAFLLALLVCLRLRKYTGRTSLSLTPSRALQGIQIQYGIQVPQQERQRWLDTEIKRIAAQMGFLVPRAANRKNAPGQRTFDMGGSDRRIWVRIRTKVAVMRVERGLQQRYRAYVLEHANLSKMDFVLTIWFFRLILLSGHIIRVLSFGILRPQIITPQGLAVIGKAADMISFQKGISVRYGRAMQHLAMVEGCCLKPGKEEAERRLDILAEALPALGRNPFVAHALHCARVRQAWNSPELHKQGTWKDITANIGSPFSHFGDSCRAFLKMPGTFKRNMYTLEQLRELARLITRKKVARKFVVEAVTQYGMFLPPADYQLLFELTREPTLRECGLAGIAWLYHSNVPLKDIPLCASLLPYIDFPQARNLAEQGVLPELLAGLKTTELLPLSDQEIAYIHKRCEEAGLEQILDLLGHGIAPYALRTTLLLGEEFPGKNPADIRTAIQVSSTLQGARDRLSGAWIDPGIGKASLTAPQEKKRKNKAPSSIETIEMEAAAGSKQSEEAPRVRVSPSSIPAGLTLRTLKRRLQREAWIRLSLRGRGGHDVYEKEKRRLYLPGDHRGEGLSRYTLADAFSQANFSSEELRKVVRG